MGKDTGILYNNMKFPDQAATRAVCLSSHAVRGDYGCYDSARAARLGSHVARGGRCGRSAAPRKYLFIRLAALGFNKFF